MSLYQRLRPTSFKQVKGQDLVVSAIRKKLRQGDFPHACLFRGGSGTGKTTVARILQKELGCSDIDFLEVNCADVRGIDSVRDIRDRMGLSPMGGSCRMWLLDEVGAITKDAQTALLKMLEDTPPHVYFILATTDPQKLLPTILTRCTPFEFKPLPEQHMKELILSALGAEKASVGPEVIDKIVEVSEGSARAALVTLEQVLTQPDEESQLELIQSASIKEAGIAICRAMADPRSKWPDVAKLVKACDEDPEKVRRLVLSWFTKMLLAGNRNSARAAKVIECFQFDYIASGKAGLALSAYNAMSS